MVEKRDEGLEEDDPLIAAEGASLGEARGGGEGGGEESVHPNAGRATVHEDLAPAHNVEAIKTHRSHRLEKPSP